MDAHSQFIKDLLKAHLRSLNARLAKHGLRGMTACGGRTGEPLMSDIIRTLETGKKIVSTFEARFPTKPDDVPATDAADSLPQRKFDLELDRNDGRERPIDGARVRVETDEGSFDGVVFHDQALWGIRWTSDFAKSKGGKKPVSGSGSSGGKPPSRGGFEFL